MKVVEIVMALAAVCGMQAVSAAAAARENQAHVEKTHAAMAAAGTKDAAAACTAWPYST